MQTLVILHRVYAGLTALSACCVGGYFLFFFTIVGAMATSAKPSDRVPSAILDVFAGLWGYAVVLLGAILVANLLAANWLRDRRNWVGVIVVSAVNCLTGVLGIALAVFTLIMINRPHIRATFESGRA